MSKKKYGVMVCLLAAFLCLLTGCATIGMDVSVTGKGSGIIQNSVKLNKAEYMEYLRATHPDMGMESDVEDIISDGMEQGLYTEDMIDGTSYLVMDSSDANIEFGSVSEFYNQVGRDSGYQLTETSFCISGSALTEDEVLENDYFDFSDMKEEDIEKYLSNSYLELSVTFDYPVKETNGMIDPANPNRVSWKYALTSEVDRIYAYCDSSISFSGVTQGTVSRNPLTLHFEGAESAEMEGQPIENDTVFSVDGTYCILLKNGVEQKTVYFTIDRTAPEFQDESGESVSFQGYQKKEQIIYLSDDGGILSAELDGKAVLECNLLDNEEFIYYVTVSPSKLADGKHTLMVKDAYGNENKITFKTDKTAPVVKGVKHKKTYQKAVKVKFSDSVSGIKKATLNGKNIKSGTKVEAVGNYTLKVKDKAGNSITVKFKIKEKIKAKSKAKKKK